MLQKKQSSYYLFFYIISLTIYGLLSTSTPDKITIVEILIGFSLLIVVGLEGLSELMKSDKYSDEHDFKVPNIVKFSFFYLIFLPSLYGLVFFENSIKNWIRDIIPLLYLFLPLLVIKKINFASRSLFLYSILLLCLVGASFSIRFFFDSVGSLSNLGTSQIIALNKDNIALDPATQFFLSFTSCFSVWLLMRGKIFYGIIILIALIALHLIVCANSKALKHQTAEKDIQRTLEIWKHMVVALLLLLVVAAGMLMHITNVHAAKYGKRFS